ADQQRAEFLSGSSTAVPCHSSMPVTPVSSPAVTPVSSPAATPVNSPAPTPVNSPAPTPVNRPKVRAPSGSNATPAVTSSNVQVVNAKKDSESASFLGRIREAQRVSKVTESAPKTREDSTGDLDKWLENFLAGKETLDKL
uniref:Uncharacterized protein n=1 Tax=Oryzias melastigma TaxID=30732 RepID=A0A3B3CER3_ORYME